MYNVYNRTLHFFTTSWKRLSVGSDFTSLEKAVKELPENEKVLVYYGPFMLGELSITDDGIWIHRYGFCKFADRKSKSKGFVITKRLYETVMNEGIELEELICLAKTDIECLIASSTNQLEEVYESFELKDYLSFYHPDFSLVELMDNRAKEDRIVLWRPS